MKFVFRIAGLLTEIPNTTSKWKSSSWTLSPVTYRVYAKPAEPIRRRLGWKNLKEKSGSRNEIFEGRISQNWENGLLLRLLGFLPWGRRIKLCTETSVHLSVVYCQLLDSWSTLLYKIRYMNPLQTLVQQSSISWKSTQWQSYFTWACK
jgi:hypothetical protein